MDHSTRIKYQERAARAHANATAGMIELDQADAAHRDAAKQNVIFWQEHAAWWHAHPFAGNRV